MYGVDNILQFIDSQAVRENITEETFTVSEWAVLISKSSKPIALKMEALKAIYENCGNTCFCPRKECNAKGCEKRNILLKELIEKSISYWNRIIDKMNDAQGAIFAACFIEKGFDRGNVAEYSYFTTYDMAYRYLKEQKQEYLDDEDLKDVITYGEIRRFPLDNPDYSCDREIYHFDNNLDLYQVYADGNSYNDIPFSDLLWEYFVYVPLPFKVGDKVKIDYGTGGFGIAEIAYNLEERLNRFSYLCEHEEEDWLSVWVWEECGRSHEWYYHHVTSLSMSYATEEEAAAVPKCPLKWGDL